jgi:hypothetical protein
MLQFGNRPVGTCTLVWYLLFPLCLECNLLKLECDLLYLFVPIVDLLYPCASTMEPAVHFRD